MLKRISLDTEFEAGKTYRFVFDVRERIPVPNFLVAERVNDFVQKIARDPRFTLKRSVYSPLAETLTLDLESTGVATPITLIAAGLIALAVVVSLIILFKSVGEVLPPRPEECEQISDPLNRFICNLGGNVFGLALAGGAVVAVLFGVRAFRQ